MSTTYTDHYPSGLPYIACGASHPNGDPTRRCSRPVDETGDHRGRRDIGHMNDLGNEWTNAPRWFDRLTAKDQTAAIYSDGENR